MRVNSRKRFRHKNKNGTTMDMIDGIEIPDEIMETIEGGSFVPKNLEEFRLIAQQLQFAGYSKEFVEGLVDPSTPNCDEYIDFVERRWNNFLKP